MAKTGISQGRGYVFTRVAHSSQPPTGGHLRSRVSSVNFTSTLSKRLMRRISPLQSVPNVASFSIWGRTGEITFVRGDQGQKGDGARGNETIIDGH